MGPFLVEANQKTRLLSTMIWLGIDTSTTFCCACLWHAGDNAILREESQDIGMGHAELLIRQIDALFADNTYQCDDLTQIVCSIGPGSFTGVRVGLASAKALAQAFNIPVIGVSTLQSLALDMAETLNEKQDFTIVIDARRSQIYCQDFDANGTAQTTPIITSIEAISELDDRPIAGTGANSLTMSPYLEDKATGSMRAMMLAASDKTAQTEPLVPLYLRSADAKQPKVPFAVSRQSDASS